MRLLQAIEQQFNNDPGLQAAGLTPLAFRRSARNSPMPYSVIVPVSEARRETTSGNVIIVQTIQFSAFGNSVAQVDGFRDLLKAAFPDSTEIALSNSTGTKVLSVRWSDLNLIEDDPGKFEQVWHAQIDAYIQYVEPRQ